MTLEKSGVIVLRHGQRTTAQQSQVSGETQSANYIGAEFSRPLGGGQKRRPYQFSVIHEYSSHAEALSWVELLPGIFPILREESVLKEIDGGVTVRIHDFVITGVVARVMDDQPNWVMVTFDAAAGRQEFVDRAGIGGPGWDEISQAWGFTGLPSAVTFQGAGGPVTEAFMWDSELGRYAGPGGVIFSEEGFWWLGAELGVMTWQGPEVGCGVLGNYEFTPPGVTVALSAEVAPVGNFVYPSIFD